MAMNAEETAELKDSLSLLSADELRAQMGDDAESDAIIKSILDGGKALETKGSEFAAEKAGANVKQDEAGGTKLDQDNAAARTGDDDDDDDDTVVDEHGNPITAEVAAPAAEAAAAPAAAEEAAAVADVSADVPALNLGFVDDKFKGQIEALDAAKAEAFEKLMDGTLPPADYAKVESKYMSDRDALAESKAFEKQWFTQVHAFQVDAAKTSGINYATDAEKGEALDQWVKMLGASPAHADKDSGWFLQEAHKRVMQQFDITPATGKTTETGKKTTVSENKVAEKQGRAPKLDNIPPTLGGLPAAKANDVSDEGEFAHIEKLSGMALERALASMSPDQQARYLAA